MPHLFKAISSGMEHSQIVDLANKENHLVIHPSHVMKKEDEIVGYMAINSIPMVHAHFGRKCSARDSITFIERAENYMRGLGQNHYFITCTDQSPFAKCMDRLKFKDLLPTRLYSKEL